jgi:D-amino-acid dehydrogenase
MMEVIKEHEIDDEVGLNDNGIVYTHYEASNPIHVNTEDGSNTKSFQRVYKDEIYNLEKCISNWEESPTHADFYAGPNWLAANSEKFTNYLAHICEHSLGIKFYFDTKVEAFDIAYEEESEMKKESKSIKKIYTNQGCIKIDDGTEVIVASGSWTARILWNFGYFTPIYPMKGYSVSFDLPDDELEDNNFSINDNDLPTRIIVDKKMYLSRLGRQVRVTSMAEFCGWDTAPDEKINKSFREQGRKHVPGLLPLFNRAPTRCGLRPQSADGVILLGRVDGMKNLSLNVGPGQTGWKLSLGAASVLAANLDNDIKDYTFDIQKLSPANKVVYAPFWSMLSRLRWT